MKTKLRILFVLLCIFSLAMLFNVSHSTPILAQEDPTSGCANFREFSPGDEIDPEFELDGVFFMASSGNPFTVTTTPNGENALFFDEDGIVIELPAPVMWVSVRAGSFTGEPLEIVAMDSNGNPVDDIQIPGDNSIHTVTLNGPDITSVIIRGGGGEGMLVEICFGTEPRPEARCVNFSGFSPGDELDPEFELDGVWFRSRSGDPFQVTTVNGETALMLNEDGVVIELPISAKWVIIRAGSFTGDPLEIVAMDSNGDPVDDTQIPGDNSIHTVTLGGEDITSIAIRGGGGEGMLVEICFGTEPLPETGCVNFQTMSPQTFPGPMFVIGPLLFINPLDNAGIPIELEIVDRTEDMDGIPELNVGYSSNGSGYQRMRVIFPHGVEVASVTLRHFNTAEVEAYDTNGMLASFAVAPNQDVRTTLILLAGTDPIQEMSWEFIEVLAYDVCWGEEAVSKNAENSELVIEGEMP